MCRSVPTIVIDENVETVIGQEINTRSSLRVGLVGRNLRTRRHLGSITMAISLSNHHSNGGVGRVVHPAPALHYDALNIISLK